MMIWLVMISILLPVALSNSEGEKWSWPSSQKDQTQQADNRKDIYYENSSDKSGRIRVPTSYYDNRRPLQAYEVKEQTTSRPRPLSDEFSDESTSSGENYGNNINGYNGNRNPSANTPNRFGPQQSNDFQPQFGYGQQYPGQQYPGQQFPGGAFGAGPTQFPGAGQYPGAFGGQRYPIGQFGGQQYPQQYPIRGQGYPGQFGQQYPQQYPIGGHGYPTNSIGNGILVGPGGPTGIIGRPYGNRYGGGFQGGFGGQAFEGQHNALGGSHLGGTPFGQGAYGQGGFGQGAYGQGGFGQGAYGQGGLGQGAYGQGGYAQGGYNPQFGGGFPGPLFDPSNTKNLQVKKIEKSAK